MKKKKDLSKYIDLVSRVRIEHTSYGDTYEALSRAYDSIGHTATPLCLLITGDTRTGKSTVVGDFLDQHVPKRVDHRLVRSVVYAVTPANASVKSLLESLLRGLGDPFWNKGSQTNMTQRLLSMLDAVECRMIVLDEFQHLCDKGQKLSIHKTADWLKVLIEGRRYGLVAVGLPIAASVVNGNIQLASRFDSELRMPAFDWCCKTSAAEFRGILRQFQSELEPFVLPNLSSAEMGLRMYLATAGRIGLVAKLLDRAVRDAVYEGRLEIRLENLATAYRSSIWFAPRFPVPGGPFGAAFEALLTDAVHHSVVVSAGEEAVADQSASVSIHGARAGSSDGLAAAPSKQRRHGTRASKGRNKSGPRLRRGEAGRVSRDLARAL